MTRSRGSTLAGSRLAGDNPFVRSCKRDPAVELHRDGETLAARWNGTLAATPGSGAAALRGVVTVPLRLSPGARYPVRVGGAATPESAMSAIACADLTRPTR